jgi:ABC-type antimicrobial peptide transport system permease subunit
MRLLLFEYILIGLIGAAMGIVGVYFAVALINISQPGANIVIAPLIVVIMVVLSICTAILSATVVAWHPTRVRPLHVLRYE